MLLIFALIFLIASRKLTGFASVAALGPPLVPDILTYEARLPA